jgi:hypothetical protein
VRAKKNKGKKRRRSAHNDNQCLHPGSFYCKAILIGKHAKSRLDDLLALLYAISSIMAKF